MIGKRIRQLREENKLLQSDLEKHLGMRQRTLFDWESGRTKIPATAIPAICEALGCTYEYIFSAKLASKKKIHPEKKLIEFFEKLPNRNKIALIKKLIKIL